MAGTRGSRMQHVLKGLSKGHTPARKQPLNAVARGKPCAAPMPAPWLLTTNKQPAGRKMPSMPSQQGRSPSRLLLGADDRQHATKRGV